MNTNTVDSNVPDSDDQTPVVPVNELSALPQVLADVVGPLDLVGSITNMMVQAGHPRPDAWMRLLDPKAHDLNLDDNYRRFLINRVLRMALADAPELTLDIRYCLVDTGDYDRWFALIASEVIPCMVTNDLPRTLS